MTIAERVGAPSVIAIAANALVGATVERDPQRAASLAEVFLTNSVSIGADLGVSIALGMLGRVAKNAEDPTWATRFRGVLDRTYDAGDTRLLLTQLDNYSQALLQIGRFESSAVLYGTVGHHALHLTNPVSITRRESQRAGLTAALGNDRVTQLVADGASLDIADAVTLARQELERVINVVPPNQRPEALVVVSRSGWSPTPGSESLSSRCRFLWFVAQRKVIPTYWISRTTSMMPVIASATRRRPTPAITPMATIAQLAACRWRTPSAPRAESWKIMPVLINPTPEPPRR